VYTPQNPVQDITKMIASWRFCYKTPHFRSDPPFLPSARPEATSDDPTYSHMTRGRRVIGTDRPARLRHDSCQLSGATVNAWRHKSNGPTWERLGIHLPDGHEDGNEDSALATQQRLSGAVRLGNSAWRAEIAVGSDASVQGCDAQDHDNDGKQSLIINNSSLPMYPLL
jgi:hypothetical protein